MTLEIEPQLQEIILELARDNQQSPHAFLAQLLNEHRPGSQRLMPSALDVIPAHIAIVSEDGTILATNQIWQKFADENAAKGNVSEGANYLQICDSTTGEDSELAQEAAAGIRAVLRGEQAEFHLEYPCHAPHEQRWFLCRVSPVPGKQPPRVVIAHENITERKQVELALRDSQKYLSDLMASLSVAVFTVKLPERQIEYANAAVETVFGYAPEEAIGQPTRMFYPDQEGFFAFGQKLQKAIAEGRPLHTEHELRRKNGELFPAELTVAYRYKDGQLVQVISVVQDITGRKQAEEALKRSESLLRKAQHIAHVGSWVWYIKTNTLEWSEEMYNIFGFDKENFTGSLSGVIDELIHPEDRARVEASNLSVIQEHKPIPVEYRIVRPDGVIRSVRGEAGDLILDDQGEPDILTGIVQDITGHKQAEQFTQAQLRLSDYALTHSVTELMQKTLDEAESLTDSEIGFFHLLEANQRILTSQIWSSNSANKLHFEDGVGQHYPVDKAGFRSDCISERRPVIYNDYENLLHGQDLPDDHATLNREMVVPIIRDDLIVAIIGLGNKPGDYDDHDVSMISRLGDTVWEIIARKRTELDLQSSKEVIALKDRFMSIVSHEFRTPLAIIQSSSDLMSRYMDRMTSERRDQSLQQIRQQIAVLSKMVDDIGAIGRAQSGRIEYYPAKIEIAEFCQTIVEQIRFADDNNHEFQFINHTATLQVMADGNLMRHILTNLLGNATKYSPANSRITFEINREDDSALIMVNDEGIGIPEADQAMLFDPFYRAGNVGTIKGTGLGLSIVKEYVELHGGRIDVESEVGKGSTFIIWLPLV